MFSALVCFHWMSSGGTGIFSFCRRLQTWWHGHRAPRTRVSRAGIGTTKSCGGNAGCLKATVLEFAIHVHDIYGVVPSVFPEAGASFLGPVFLFSREPEPASNLCVVSGLQFVVSWANVLTPWCFFFVALLCVKGVRSFGLLCPFC